MLSEEIVEDLSFFFEISKKIVIVTNWWNTSYFFVFLIFQLWQVRDSECTEIFEKTEYVHYFGNSTPW